MTTPSPHELRWFVAHTRPRCEKKFAALAAAEQFTHELPLVDSVRTYARQTKHYTKPIFPGYVFVQLPLEHKGRCYQQDLLVRLIPVDNEPQFLTQLEDVRRLAQSGLELLLHPLLKRGTVARVVSGPLRGIEGIIDDPTNPQGIVISIDVLRQGLLVKVPFHDLQPL